MPTSKKKAVRKNASSKNWSATVTHESNALDLDPGVFELKDPSKIAKSLKRSAINSTRKKGTSFQSAMSMLNFYINRGGKNLPLSTKKTLERAKNELRHEFDKPSKD